MVRSEKSSMHVPWPQNVFLGDAWNEIGGMRQLQGMLPRGPELGKSHQGAFL